MGCSVSDTRAISHSSLFARVSYCTLSVTFRSLLETKALDCQTILTVPLFVLLTKYAHIRAIVPLIACRVIARVSVHSPFPLFSRGGSHFRPKGCCCFYPVSCVFLLHMGLLITTLQIFVNIWKTSGNPGEQLDSAHASIV